MLVTSVFERQQLPVTVTRDVSLTSAWPPALSSLLHRSHFRHNLCQSLPSEDTFSAAEQRDKRWGQRSQRSSFYTHQNCIIPAVNLTTNTVVMSPHYISPRDNDRIVCNAWKSCHGNRTNGATAVRRGRSQRHWECLCTIQDAAVMSSEWTVVYVLALMWRVPH